MNDVWTAEVLTVRGAEVDIMAGKTYEAVFLNLEVDLI